MVTKKIPTGFKLHQTLSKHTGIIARMAWSHDGGLLATPARDGTVRIWNPFTGELQKTFGEGDTGKRTVWFSSVAWSPNNQTLAVSSNDMTVWLWDVETGNLKWGLDGHQGPIYDVSWSADGSKIATASYDRTVRLWDPSSYELLWTLNGHSDRVLSVAWSPDGKLFASGGSDNTIRIWGGQVGLQQQILTGHAEAVTYLDWTPDGTVLASASLDNTIRIWDVKKGRLLHILESHSGGVVSASFSADGQILASKSKDNTVQLWRCNSWEPIARLDEISFFDGYANAMFHPQNALLASLGEGDSIVRIWELDIPYLLEDAIPADTVHYVNSKVVLVGDSGVGKTGLGLVLTGQSFQPTESTHGRHVWTLEEKTVTLSDGRKETRETLLWDLAGQPGYRLIHQLHLNEVAIALVVFSSLSAGDPFSGVRHWARALRQAQIAQSEPGWQMKTFLVAARMDRGGIGASQERIRTIIDELGFEGYFETSAKEGWDIPQLQKAIESSLEWHKLPKVSSTDLFQTIKEFLLTEKENERILTTFDALYRDFYLRYGNEIRLLTPSNGQDSATILRTQFATCIGRVESRGLIRRLSFGNLVLLQPELLDAYASAIVHTAREDIDGLGSVPEEVVITGRFRMSDDERIPDRAQEHLLLIATVEDLLRHEVALREASSGLSLLVFPSEFTKAHGDLPAPEGQAVFFSFKGSIHNVYATLAIRLSRSIIFVKEKMWRNGVVFRSRTGFHCGIMLTEIEEGKGEITVFFDGEADQETRFQFEEYVRIHLMRRALPDTVFRRRVFACSCGFVVTDQLANMRAERGFNWLHCPVCAQRVSLIDRTQHLTGIPSEVIPQIDQAADEKREIALTDSIFQGKLATADFDVMFCFHEQDKRFIKPIADQLKELGILSWPYSGLENIAFQTIQTKSVVFFLGRHGIGPGNTRSLYYFLRNMSHRGAKVIPALFRDAPLQTSQPSQITNDPWIDFQVTTPNPIELLVDRITEGRGKTSQRQRSVWVTLPTPSHEVPQIVNLRALFEAIEVNFDETQLRNLCSLLHIRYADLQKAGKGTFITEALISHCNRRGKIHELIVQCKKIIPSFVF